MATRIVSPATRRTKPASVSLDAIAITWPLDEKGATATITEKDLAVVLSWLGDEFGGVLTDFGSPSVAAMHTKPLAAAVTAYAAGDFAYVAEHELGTFSALIRDLANRVHAAEVGDQIARQATVTLHVEQGGAA